MSRLSDTVGDVMGGQELTITGTNLATTRSVCLGLKCVSVTAATAASVTVTTPPHHGYRRTATREIVPDYQEGDVDVSLVLADTSTIKLAEKYRYSELTATGGEMSYVLAHWTKEEYDRARYGDFGDIGGDCMNFASAALAEWFGPTQTRPDWNNTYADWVATHLGKDPYQDPYGHHDPADRWVTESWAYVPAFSQWLNENTSKLDISRSALSADPATWTNIRVGDIVTVTWTDKKQSGFGHRLDRALPTSAVTTSGDDHTMIVSRVTNDDGQIDIQFAGHTEDRDYLPLADLYAMYPTAIGSIWHLPTT